MGINIGRDRALRTEQEDHGGEGVHRQVHPEGDVEECLGGIGRRLAGGRVGVLGREHEMRGEVDEGPLGSVGQEDKERRAHVDGGHDELDGHGGEEDHPLERPDDWGKLYDVLSGSDAHGTAGRRSLAAESMSVVIEAKRLGSALQSYVEHLDSPDDR